MSVFSLQAVAQMVKNVPATWETRVRSLGWEDPLEKGMATYSNILARCIPWTEGSSGLQSMWPQSQTTEPLPLSLFTLSLPLLQPHQALNDLN